MEAGGPHDFSRMLEEFATYYKNALTNDPTMVGSRYPVVRTGPRAELPAVLRWLVWHRDSGVCKLCGAHDVPVELDHVIPWSAGGADHSTNLRVLCVPCNQQRSNYRLLGEPRLHPVTPLCDSCMLNHDDLEWRSEYHGYYKICPLCAGFNLPRPAELGPFVVAFCGCCKAMSQVSDPGRLL